MCYTCKHPILHKTIIKSKQEKKTQKNNNKNILHILDLISKLYIFIPFYKSYFTYVRQNCTLSSMQEQWKAPRI